MIWWPWLTEVVEASCCRLIPRIAVYPASFNPQGQNSVKSKKLRCHGPAMVLVWWPWRGIPSLRGCPDKKANHVCCDSGRPSCTVHRRSSCASYIPGPRKWRQCKCWTKNDKGSLVVYKQSRQTKTRALTSPSWWNYSQLTRVVEPCWTPLSHQRNVKTWKWTSYFIRIHSWSSAPDSCFTRFLGTKNASITQPQRTNTT